MHNTNRLSYDFNDLLIYNAIIIEVENELIKNIENEIVDYLEKGDPKQLNIFLIITQIIIYKNYLTQIINSLNYLESKSFMFRPDWPSKEILKSLNYTISIIEKMIIILDKPYQLKINGWSLEKIQKEALKVIEAPEFYKYAGLI